MKEVFNRNRSSSSFIIAHVDASKESLVERLLASMRSAPYRPYDLLDREFESSSSSHSNAQTQLVSAESNFPKERGITIPPLEHPFWDGIRWPLSLLSLIDSPGHMDFTQDCMITAESAQTNTQTQLIPAQYSYANFQQTFFANSEKPEKDDYVLIEKNDISDQNQPSKDTTQCRVM